MISVKEAWALIAASAKLLPLENIPLSEATGRVVRQSLLADRDYPPFDRVAMDGFAVRTPLQDGQSLRVQDMQTAGQAAKTLLSPAGCIEIMTGAVLPEGSDAVVRYEDTQRDQQHMRLNSDVRIKALANVHRRGSDCKAGDPLCADGTTLTAPLIAMAASFGYETLKVSRPALLTILSTGDELVPLNQKPLDYQIRSSNIYALQAAVESRGHKAHRVELLPDIRASIHARVEAALQESDVILISGGVSAGKTDFVPSVLADCGVEKVFHKVAQKPGKPLWFGVSREGKAVFGLPGNPMSALICAYRYVLPLLAQLQGRMPEESPLATLAGAATLQGPLALFVPVRLAQADDARTVARAVTHQGSGDFASLTRSQGFVELSPGLPPEPTVPYFPW